MTHDIPIILDDLECAAALAAHAEWQQLEDLILTLKQRVSELDTYLQTLDKENPQIEEVHELLENIQTVAADMCGNQNIAGREAEIQGLIDQCDFYLS